MSSNKENSLSLSRMLRIAVYQENDSETIRVLEEIKREGIYNAERYFECDHKATKMIGKDLASVFESVLMMLVPTLKTRAEKNSDGEIVVSYIKSVDLEDVEITQKTANKLFSIIEEFISKDFADKGRELTLKKNGNLRKNGKEEILKMIDHKIMQKRFNMYVLSNQMTYEMKKGNVGNRESKKVKSVSKKINGNTENLHEYAPKNLIKKVAQERRDSQKAMKKMKIKGSDKTVFDVAKTDKNKFYEHYIEMNALSEIADEKGFTWLFITPTCPPEYHSNPANGKRKFNNSSVKETDQYLAKKWNNLRKRLTKSKYEHLSFSLETGYGKRVKEPQKDATVHYHYMLFCRKDLVNEYYDLFKSIFGQSDVECDIVRKGYKKDRKTGKEIKVRDDKEASAASYIMKYISKGLSVDILDESGEVVNLEKAHIEAWKKCGGIRAISSFGFDGVRTKYNEARKINNRAKKTIYDIKENDREFKDEVREKLTNNIANTKWSNKKIPQMINSMFTDLCIDAFIKDADKKSIEEKVVLCNTEKKEDEEQIRKIAKILKLAEKKPSYCKKDEVVKWKIPYKEFMIEAKKLEHTKEERLNKRKAIQTVNTGIKIEGNEVEIKL